MGRKFVEFIFFGNYFVGLLAVALSLETAFQLQIHFNSTLYYVLLFLGTVMYYTYAYSGITSANNSINPRTIWYAGHHNFIRWSQPVLLCLCTILSLVLLFRYYENILHLPITYCIVVGVICLAAILYYGLIPKSFIKINLRNTGWLKAFIIGLVWACCVNLLPLVVLQIERGAYYVDPVFALWLFMKNWMFCTANAIMFDLKDYEDDSNHQLKTFVVRYGLQKTIFYVLIPLLGIGVISLLFFAHFRHFKTIILLFNLTPFIFMLIVARSMLRHKNILYYLIVIDGLLLVKAICGIVGSQFNH
ncbi:UbiA family prenyltransferase [Dyadobacter sp. CY356]|uniref:UbiA family prenyltransferase n=1 Tax=Dyadobacter sp. CY356 TaxID=2906442 RepID=UPI001F2AD5D0|nr:UbiA family prenyltransferase [Dyadobacter sp. CY356]MCF0058010.1 UbiA family prenyltransferase [Dyadobacter sp. CY356]